MHPANRPRAGKRSAAGRFNHTSADMPHAFGAKELSTRAGVVATPLCSPQLMAGAHPLLRPADLRHHTLLHDDTISAEQGGVDWNAWLKAAKVRDVDTLRGAHFNQAVMGLAAAIDGAGVVLSYPLLASSDLAEGRLIAPFDLEVKVDFAYFMLSAENADIEPGVAAFRDWMIDTARTNSPQ